VEKVFVVRSYSICRINLIDFAQHFIIYRAKLMKFCNAPGVRDISPSAHKK